MPTYEYECRHCEHRFDHLQGFHDPILRKCPECGRLGLSRLFGSGAGIVFKGSGFYETDYKRKGQPQKDGKSDGNSDGDKSSGDKSSGDKSSGDKSSGDKPSSDTPSSDTSSSNKPSGDAPGGGKGGAGGGSSGKGGDPASRKRG